MTLTEPVVAVVVAAGAGVRLGGQVPKALREVAGRSLVRHSLDGLAAGGVDHAVVVISPVHQALFDAALADSPVPVSYAFGGRRRQDSVAAGLVALEANPQLKACRLVLVHDAARAFVPGDVVAAVIAALNAGAAGCVPAVPVVDSIRELDSHGGSKVVDRSRLRAVQTPQGFRREVLVAALAAAEAAGLDVSDDASAVEAAGGQVALVTGSREAMKVTEPADLIFAEAIVRSRR